MRLCLLLLTALLVCGCATSEANHETVAEAQDTPNCYTYSTTLAKTLCLQQSLAKITDLPNTVIYFLSETDKIVDGLLSGTLSEPQAELALARVSRNTMVMADAEVANARLATAQNQAATSGALLGLGLGLLNQSQQRPAFGMTSCSYVGNFLNCQHY